ncbi:DNA topoisomerase III [Labilithrix luteola]|uniref:ATP-dependent DNA helicase RecQ n=1 Tax=Labilithrix luteola TaxID=1391654 RepID=A0A0K1PX75_9BACT|nr:DNA topoisomerase III [Labilithrix luteola]
MVAEKPSVARDIAQVLGARGRGEGHFSGAGFVVTWAIGHLVTLAEPHEIKPEWKRWRLADLPLLPSSWPLVVSGNTRDQFRVVEKFLRSSDVREVVCATDAGREGELIFRYIYEAARAKKPVKRLWISSLTADAIANGFRSLRSGKDFDRLADAARARSRADWLVGMNLSRLYSVVHDDNLSVGRVQTPTLAMLVARELEIREFVPEDYLEVVATFAPPDAAKPTYEGTYVRPGVKEPDTKRLPPDGKDADAIIARAKRGQARIESVERQQRKLPPPQLYDLTELQRHANRLYGFTAERTLKIAQSLYEKHKLISYPRTDSRHLSKTVASTLPAIVRAIEEPYRAHLAEGTGVRPLGLRFVDDAHVSDHHAIIPTETKRPASLPPDEQKIYDLVCRRLLSAWHVDHVFAVTTVVTGIVTTGAEGTTTDRYVSTGTSVEIEGWKVLDVPLGNPRAKSSAPPEPTLPGGLAKGMVRRVADAKAVAKKTRPPPRFTDGTLLTAMETAGRTLDEKELSRAMRDRGLGTPATRAAILETLLRREYVVRDGKLLAATDKGVGLVERVHPHVKSPAMTGEWEAKLARIERGEENLDSFMKEIERYVHEVIGGTPKPTESARSERTSSHSSSFPPPERASSPALRTASRSSSLPPARTPTNDAPARPSPPRKKRERTNDLAGILRAEFGFESFRPYQEDVCRAAASGKDVLLVMPTGAGKSLCYQLPGIARGGTTLVVSPLIALMEDQVAQLVGRGFAAERIHSGRDRLSSRAACKAYLEGELDFLFIAPERLRVPGFPEMLARRKPTLIAIDEAHCISQWGHDFRPDYRMLGERLPLLRPAPVIALTATATPSVQDDIAEELGLSSSARFIHGFRRTNIGVEVISRPPGDRPDVVRRLLDDPARRPAIVYAPTRNESEELASALSRKVRAAAYHAGLATDVRDDVQARFLAGKLDVIVATTAFGMGIDKPDVRTVIHTALPSTVEGYYQEIGRAGRDGKPSRALLIHSYVDTKTHTFFLERDYPETSIVAAVKKKISAKGISISDLSTRSKIAPEIFEKALEKLWVHGGVRIQGDTVVPGESDWRKAYEKQRAHKTEQLDRMQTYAETTSCRMLGLVRHFGDQNDSGKPCGICDVCAPDACTAQEFRTASHGERAAALKIIEALRERDGRAVGQIHRDLFGDGSLDRRALDHVLGALARAGEITITQEAFEKDGTKIPFQRVRLARFFAGDERPAAPLRVVATPARKPRERSRSTKRSKRSKRPKRTRSPR